jgi:hypothetical protein
MPAIKADFTIVPTCQRGNDQSGRNMRRQVARYSLSIERTAERIRYFTFYIEGMARSSNTTRRIIGGRSGPCPRKKLLIAAG